MYIVFFLLWIIAIVVLVNNPENETNRWFSLLNFELGCICTAFVIENDFAPYIGEHFTTNSEFYHLTDAINKAILISFPYLFTLSLTMFTLSGSGILQLNYKKIKRVIAVVMLISLPGAYILFPENYIGNAASFGGEVWDVSTYRYSLANTLWIVPFIIFSCTVMLNTYVKEKIPVNRREKKALCIILIPTLLVIAVFGYVLNLFKIYSSQCVYFGLVYYFIAFGFFTARGRVMGIRIVLTENLQDKKMKAMTSGISILNHTIKNQILKISLNMDMIKSCISDSDQKLSENIRIVQNTIKQLLELIGRGHERLQKLVLKESVGSLTTIMDEVLYCINPQLENKNIKVVRNFKKDFYILCDSLFLSEVFQNIFLNAVDAMENGGELDIRPYIAGRHLVIAIQDNGSGISKEALPHVIEPFFSTKKTGSNFGLGLSHCYNVLKRHDGYLKIESEENCGTTVFIHLPLKRIVKAVASHPQKELIYE